MNSVKMSFKRHYKAFDERLRRFNGIYYKRDKQR